MDPQSARGLGNVVAAVGKNTMDVLPFGLCQGWNRDFFFGRWHFDLDPPAFERIEDIIEIGGFGKKIHCAEFDRVDGSGDAPESGEDQDSDFG